MSEAVEQCKTAMQALSDWAATYASDMCDAETVAKAKQRIHQHGTLAYIANATDQLQSVISALSEAEHRAKNARREALEEAAKTIEEGFDRGIARKRDLCAHKKFKWEYCEPCAANAVRALIPSEPHDAEVRQKPMRGDPSIFDDAEGRN